MKEREPTHSDRLSPSKKEQSTGSPELVPSESGEDRLDEDAMLVPPSEEAEFESLSVTRISNAPIVQESEDALVERDPNQPLPSKTGTSSKRTTSVLGDFQLVKKLGQGAMASVYKARQLGTDRKVALKLLHKHVADTPKLVERFYREARIMGQLDHPNIVQGFSVGEIDGFHYCAMEYISGANLQHWLNRLVRLTVPDAVHIAICCARALDYAHEHGLVHRDIKPDNVLITKHGQVKVADLGMVKAQDEDMSLTQTGHAVGTPWYMPLEQAKNAKDVDGRSDIYALGCMIYCMLTGRPPFRGGSIVEVIQAKEIGTFPPARQFNPAVPDRLDLIIAKMTAKQPKHRYQNCREVLEDLESLEVASPVLTFVRQTELNLEEETLPSVPGEVPPAGRSISVPTNEWYLRLKTSEGDPVVKKFTTSQVFKMIESGQITPNTKASRTEDGNYRSVATYKEFESVALALATRSNIDKQTTRYREIYKQLEEEDLLHREKKKQNVDDLDDSIKKVLRISLIIGGGLIGGLLVLWLGYIFIRLITG